MTRSCFGVPALWEDKSQLELLRIMIIQYLPSAMGLWILMNTVHHGGGTVGQIAIRNADQIKI